jgi:short-subunit dehydrogenase
MHAEQRRAVVIGGSTGIGKALVRALWDRGYRVAATARRYELLEQLRREIAPEVVIRGMDIADIRVLPAALDELAAELGGVDLLIVAAAVGGQQDAMAWPSQQQVIDVNVRGAAAVLTWAYEYFRARGSGHIVAVTSIAGLRGNRFSPAYSASKAFVAHYLQGLRQKLQRERCGITVTDICPGFVDTPMVANRRGMFWVSNAEKAAGQICAAIMRKKPHAYISRRWRIVGWLIKNMPVALYNRL